MVKRPDADAAIDRALRTVIGSNATGGEACPEPDEVAAYAEGGLTPGERARLEAHAASCARCLDVLGAFARASGSAAPPPETVSAAEPQRTGLRSPWWSGWRLRWAAPVAAAVTAVALYVAVDRDWRTANVPPVVSDAPASPAETKPSPEKAVPPRTTAAPASALPQARDLEANESEAPVMAAHDLPGRVVVPPALPETEARRKAQPDARRQVEAADAAPPRRDPEAVPPPTQAAPVAQPAASAERPSLRDGMAASRPEPPAAAAPAVIARSTGVTASPVGQAEGHQRQDAPAQIEQMQKMAFEPVRATAGAPGGAVHWRVGVGGAIERSTDAGASWDTQASGVQVDLLAVSAPAPGTAWVVGRLGTVLLTIDGETWQRRTFPEAVDLVFVEAIDGRRATVAAADRRRWATTDGGQSWTRVR